MTGFGNKDGVMMSNFLRMAFSKAANVSMDGALVGVLNTFRGGATSSQCVVVGAPKVGLV